MQPQCAYGVADTDYSTPKKTKKTMLLNNNIANEDLEDPTMETDRHVQVFLNSTFAQP